MPVLHLQPRRNAMPMDRTLYPDDWEAIAFRIKTAANWTCQQCQRPCRRPGETVDELAARLAELDPNAVTWLADLYVDSIDPDTGEPTAIAKPQRFTLTVAHLDHRPANCHPSNLKALCAPCHCRYDLSQMALKRQLRAERAGQLRLEGV
jgi:hypothetical protein